MQEKLVGNISKCEVSFIWTIDNFSTYENCKLKSNEFTSYCNNNPATCYLTVYPKGNAAQMYRDYVGIFLYSKNEMYVELFVNFSVLNSEMKKVVSRTLVIQRNINKSGFGYPTFVSHSLLTDKANGLLTDDKLVIMCEVSNSEFDKEIDMYSRNEIKAGMNRIEEFDEFEQMFCNDTFADVTLSIDEEKIPSHKNVLACRSSVFKKILEERKDERITNIEIKNIKCVVMKELLRFIYAGKVNDIDEIAFDLLDAANTYKVKGVKSLCEASLRATLDEEKAIEYLKLSDAYAADELKDHVVNYIVKKSKDIVKLPSFKSTADLNSSLLSELLRAIITKQ